MADKCKKCGAPLTESTIIDSFEPGSAAANSPLKEGDKIIEINKIPVDSFNDISEHEVTNSLVTVKVKRNKQVISVLLPDANDFFTRQIKYKKICKKCNKIQGKTSKSGKLKTAILILFLFVFILILAIIFMLHNADEMDQPIDGYENTTETEEIVETTKSKSEVIQEILASSDYSNENIENLAIESEYFELFDPVIMKEYNWRKMFTNSENIDVDHATVRGYSDKEVDKETLEMLIKIKAAEMGKIYFDYGEWLNDSDKYPDRGVINAGEYSFSDMRFYETAAAIANLLADIPENYLDNAYFLIEGHTDGVSPHAFNQGLSEKRASAIKNVMTEMFNIPEERILIKGYSWDFKEVSPEVNPIDFAMNRRVVLNVCFFE